MDRKRRIQLYPQNESKYQEYLKQAEENVVYKVPGINRIRNTIVVNMTIQKSLVDFLTIQGIDDYLLNCLKATMSTYVWKAGKEMCEDMQAKIAKSKKCDIFRQWQIF